MLGLFQRILGAGASAPARPDRLPAELVAAIGAASVTFRPTPDPETGEDRTYVAVAGVGSWLWSGTSEAAAKIRAAWPELSDPQARHAAHLLGGEIGRRSYETAKGLRPARRGWMGEIREFDYARL